MGIGMGLLLVCQDFRCVAMKRAQHTEEEGDDHVFKQLTPLDYCPDWKSFVSSGWANNAMQQWTLFRTRAMTSSSFDCSCDHCRDWREEQLAKGQALNERERALMRNRCLRHHPVVSRYSDQSVCMLTSPRSYLLLPVFFSSPIRMLSNLLPGFFLDLYPYLFLFPWY